MNRIVVMGGSFNPPTRAHLLLMQAATEAIDARIGVFVPTSHEYVLRKMKRQQCPEDTLSEELRLAMLESLCAEDERLSVCDIQMTHTTDGSDYQMLSALQEEYPDDELFLLVGSDKLYIITRWREFEKLINEFRVLVCRRGEDDIEKIKEIRPLLAKYWERFTVFDSPEDIREISSSAFRERLHNNDESAAELVTPEIWELLRVNGKIPWKSITNFHDEEYRFLSNFYEAPIEFDGLVFGSNEAAFQAQKCLTQEEKLQFTEFSPGKSKGVGRRVALRPDWEEVKFGLMEEIVRAKFIQHPELAKKLLETGDKILVEGNTWGDMCWGVNIKTGQGQNRLGKILMKIREELRNAG